MSVIRTLPVGRILKAVLLGFALALGGLLIVLSSTAIGEMRQAARIARLAESDRIAFAGATTALMVRDGVLQASVEIGDPSQKLGELHRAMEGAVDRALAGIDFADSPLGTTRLGELRSAAEKMAPRWQQVEGLSQLNWGSVTRSSRPGSRTAPRFRMRSSPCPASSPTISGSPIPSSASLSWSAASPGHCASSPATSAS